MENVDFAVKFKKEERKSDMMIYEWEDGERVTVL